MLLFDVFIDIVNFSLPLKYFWIRLWYCSGVARILNTGRGASGGFMLKGAGAEPNCCAGRARRHVHNREMQGGDWGQWFFIAPPTPPSPLRPHASPRLRRCGIVCVCGGVDAAWRPALTTLRKVTGNSRHSTIRPIGFHCASSGNWFRFSFSSHRLLLWFMWRIRHSRFSNCARFGHKREANRIDSMRCFLLHYMDSIQENSPFSPCAGTHNFIGYLINLLSISIQFPNGYSVKG